MKILTAEQMRNVDRRATERFGIPSLVLMENAALAVVDAIFEHYADCDRAAIFCGTGTNGGDGLAIARHLENRGVVPAVFIVGDRRKYTGDAETNLTICERLALPMYEITDDDSLNEALVHAADADVVVDAIFGTGLNRAPEGHLRGRRFGSINELGLPIVAVDLPSGANASSAEPFEPCVQAAVTVTFAAPKICHVFEPAAILCGEVIVADISIPDAAIEDEGVTLALTTPADVRPFIEPRLASTHKGNLRTRGDHRGLRRKKRRGGHVRARRDPHRRRTRDGDDRRRDREARARRLDRVDDVSARDASRRIPQTESRRCSSGPAFPITSARTRGFARLSRPSSCRSSSTRRRSTRSPDAQRRSIRSAGRASSRRIPARWRASSNRNERRRRASHRRIAREAARDCNCVVVLKGHQTLIADPEGHVNVNPTGNPGMATGGMGDVLGGMIAAFLARGVDPFDAACAAVYLHGFAGDLLKDEMGDTGLAALDLAERIPIAIKRLSFKRK